MKTVDKKAETHYVDHVETMFKGWMDKFSVGDVVIVSHPASSHKKHYVVELVKQLREL